MANKSRYFNDPIPQLYIPTSAASADSQQGMFGNVIDSAQAGALSAVGGIFDFVGADGIAKQFYGWSDKQYEQMSDAGREAMGRQFFEEDQDGNLKIGEGLTSLDTWLLTMANVAGQFAGTAIPGAGAAGAVARAANLGSKGRAAANVVGMGATGGAAATGQGMEQAREEVRNMPDELLADSAIFRDLYLGIDASKPDWNEEQKWDAAKEALAAQVAREVQTDPVALAANFGASAIGDPIIGRALTGARLAKNGAFRSAVRGALIEGSTEAVQAGTQQYSINQALQPIDGRDDMDGVRLAAINEGLAGAGFGGVAGGFGGIANRQPAQPSPTAPQVDPSAPISPAAPVDPAVSAVAEQNPALGAELNALDQASANRQRDVEQALNRQRDLDMPTAARNAGFANSPQDVGRFGDMLTSPVQRSIAELDEMRARTVADMVAMATQDKSPTPQDRFSPIPYEYEVIPAEKPKPAGLLSGILYEGEYLQGYQAEQPPAKIEQKDIIFAGDNRPAQQAQERSQELERMANRFADNSRNQPARIPQKDIIFAGNETGVTVKQNGQPFQSAKEALASKSAREAKKAGNQIEAVPFADGYGWQVAAPNIIEQAPSISQATDTNVGTTLSDQAAVMPSPETDTAPQAAQEAQAMPASEPAAEVEATPVQDDAAPLDNAEPAADLAGEAIDPEWTAFADDTGTKKIPRAEMPQIKAAHRGAMVQFMKGRDITHEQDTVPAVDLKPTQAEFSPEKVKNAMEFDGGNRSILVSSDGYVLDGHHQWLAAREKGEAVDVIRLNAPIDTLIPLAREFPSSTVADGATDASPETAVSETNQTPEQSGVSVSEDAESEVNPTENNATEPAAPIEDFGEKIGGARKDVWGGFSDAINSDASTAELPLSKSFPEPDYVKMAADGVPMETLALIAAMRAEIPAKPRTAWKVRSWAEKVDVLRGFAADLINGDLSTDEVIKAMRLKSGDLGALADAVPAIAKANPETLKLAAKYRLSSGSYSMFRGQEYRPNKVFYMPQHDKTVIYDLASDNKQAALDNLSALIAAEANANKDTPGTKQSKIDVYQNRYTKQVYLGWKGGSGVLKIQDFPSVNAARDYLQNNRAEVEAKLERIKETPDMRRAENRDRIGPPRFAGNVTPAIFADTFGFRGVEFGNWVEQGRRQKDLNEAYDALMDLAEVLGIPPKAIALNGELGMAFGARGKGGKRNAKAHYELSYVVINLTKEKGAGSLAHEWWHAVDNYFARSVGKKNAFATDGTGVRGDAMRKEVRAAFDDVMSAIRKSGLIQRSAKLDQRRSKPYWSTTEEASARSFEAFIIAELEAKGFSNDYLANIIEPEAWNALEEMQGNLPDQTYPYPTKAEQAAINPAYRNLFDTLQTKETDKGTMLFSKQTESSNFKKWFGDSKAVDEQGNPQVLYHGTAADFSEFSKKKATDKEGRKLGFGWGRDKFYFADNGQAASSAAEFAQMTGRGNQPNVMPVFLKVENPITASEYKAKVDAEIASGKTRDQAIAAVDRAIKRQGYDGIYDADTGAYAVFEPEQIKSAIGNDGRFNPNNPDIRFAAANTTGTKPAKGVPISVAQREADRFVERLSGAAGIKVQVLPTQQDAEKLWRMSLDGDFVRGAYSDKTGTVYIIAENARNMTDLRQTIAHELFAHGGLDKVIGADKKQEFLNRLKGTRGKKEFKGLWSQIDRDYDGMSEDVKAEELFAYFVQNQPQRGPVKFWWNAFKRWLNNILANLGITSKGDPDVDLMQSMMESIMFGFQFGRQADSNAEGNMAFSKDSDVTETEAFKRWFGDSKVVDEDGKPLVVYHGSNNEFDAFDPSKSEDMGMHFGTEEQARTFTKGEPRAFYLKIDNMLELDFDPTVMPGDYDFGGNYFDGMLKEIAYELGIYDVLDGIRSGNEALEAAYDAAGVIDSKVDEMIESDADIREVRQAKELKAYWKAVQSLIQSQGYDGYSYRNELEGEGTSYAVFDPEQIKSATDNNGDFDPGNPGIRFSKTKDTRTAREKIGQAQVASQTISDRIKNTVDTIKDSSWWKAVGTRATEGIFDGLHGIKKAEEAAGVTDPNRMGYVSARLATGLGDMLHALFSQGALEWRGGVTQVKQGTKGLLEVFGMLPEGDGLNNWLAWMAANRAEKLMAEGRENNLTEADIAELKALARGNEALFEEVRKEYNKINSATLDLAEQAGLISAEQRAGFDEEWYVPFFREMDIADPDLNDVVKAIKAPFTTKTGIVGQSANIKALIGGTQSTQDLLQNIIQRQVSMIDAAVKNNAAREVAGNLDGTGFMTREDSPEFDAAVEALGLTRNELATKHQKVRIMENGKPVYYYVHDAALLRGLMQVHDVGSKALFNKMARSAKRFLTTGVTLSPDFIIRNFIRDAAHAWMVNKDGAKLGTDTWKGLKASWQGDPNYWKLIASGAAFQGGYIHGADPEAAQQQIRRALRANGMTTKQVDGYMASIVTSKDKLMQAFEKYRQASDKLENSNRMTVYERAIAAGKSERQALFESKDLMDYSLKGNFGLMGTLIDMLPFFNARLQGLYKLGRAAAAEGDDQLFRVLSRDLAMKGLKVAAFSTALAAMYGDDERYKKLAEWDKDAHWHFFLGEGTDGHIRIPKPFELGIVFGTFPERLFNFAAGNQSGKDAREAVGHAVFNTLALNPVPQLVMPVYEVLRNKSSFTGAPIETLADQQREKKDRYDERTSDVTRALGSASALAGLSPKQVEHLVTGYTGTLGGYVLGMADFMARVMTGREKASTPAADWPIVRTLYQGGKEQRNTMYQQRFIESLEKAREAYGSYKLAIDEQDPDRAQRQFEKRAKELNARLPLERIQRRVSDINKAMRTVERDTRLSSSEKKDRLQQLQRQKNELYEQAYMRLELRNW